MTETEFNNFYQRELKVLKRTLEIYIETEYDTADQIDHFARTIRDTIENIHEGAMLFGKGVETLPRLTALSAFLTEVAEKKHKRLKMREDKDGD